MQKKTEEGGKGLPLKWAKAIFAPLFFSVR